MGLFGKNKNNNPKDQVKQWTAILRKEQFNLERQMRGIRREEDKVKKSLKEAAKKGSTDVCKILAKEIFRARKAVNNITTSKVHINSIMMILNHQLAILKVSGNLEKSATIMKNIQSLMKIPEMFQPYEEMSKEMLKAGILETIEELLEIVGEDQEDIEEEAQEEIDKILYELTEGQLGTTPKVILESPNKEEEKVISSTSKQSDVVPDTQNTLKPFASKQCDDMPDMEERLQALRNLYMSFFRKV